NATSASFTGLKVGTTYTFTVTVTNADGQDTATSNPVVAGACSPTATPVATSYFAWFDTATPGMDGDNIHLLNTGSGQSIGCVLLGSQAIPYSLGAGQSTHVKFRNGSIGGPVGVRVMTGAGVLASQRVQFNQSFNEVWSASAAQASTKSFFNWFDKASPGMLNDNIHVLNPGTTANNVTVSLSAAEPQSVSVGPGAETYVSFPQGTIGGPVTVTATQPVLASQRVQYYSSFNEVPALTAAKAATMSYINWYDKASAGMVNDNIHLLNPGNASATVTVSLPGAAAQDRKSVV